MSDGNEKLQGWHLDRKVPISIILTMLGIAGAGMVCAMAGADIRTAQVKPRLRK